MGEVDEGTRIAGGFDNADAGFAFAFSRSPAQLVPIESDDWVVEFAPAGALMEPA